MTEPQAGDDTRAAQAGSPVALVLIDLLADPSSALYLSLRVCDLFFFRRTCKEAWRRVHHKVLTKNNLWETAINEEVEPHVPMMRWCVRQEVHADDSTRIAIGATGNMSLIEEYLALYGGDELVWLFVGAVKAGDVTTALSLRSRLGVDALNEFGPGKVKPYVSSGGEVKLAQLLNLTPHDWEYLSIVPALKKGHVRFVQWVLSETTLDPVCQPLAVTRAAESGLGLS
jgi:hypothetical protein